MCASLIRYSPSVPFFKSSKVPTQATQPSLIQPFLVEAFACFRAFSPRSIERNVINKRPSFVYSALWRSPFKAAGNSRGSDHVFPSSVENDTREFIFFELLRVIRQSSLPVPFSERITSTSHILDSNSISRYSLKYFSGTLHCIFPFSSKVRIVL